MIGNRFMSLTLLNSILVYHAVSMHNVSVIMIFQKPRSMINTNITNDVMSVPFTYVIVSQNYIATNSRIIYHYRVKGQ